MQEKLIILKLINKLLPYNKLVFFALLPFVFDMGGDFGIRWVGLVAFFLLILKSKIKPAENNVYFLGLLLVIYPIVSFLNGINRGGDLSLASSQLYACLFGFVAIIALTDVPISESLEGYVKSFFLLSCFVILLGIGLALENDTAIDVANYMQEMGGGYFGYKPNIASYPIPNVYFKSTLFYCLPLVFYVINKKYLLLIFTTLASLFTASKMLILFSVGCCIYSIPKTRRFFLIPVATISLYILSDIAASNNFFELLAGEIGSYETRIGHLQTVIELWAENPIEIFFGSGLGMTFFSYGANEVVSNIEIDHLNTIRKFGLLWFVAFGGYVFLVSRRLLITRIDSKRVIGVGTLSAFILSGTNPVLLSPLFFILLGMAACPRAIK